MTVSAPHTRFTRNLTVQRPTARQSPPLSRLPREPERATRRRPGSLLVAVAWLFASRCARNGPTCNRAAVRDCTSRFESAHARSRIFGEVPGRHQSQRSECTSNHSWKYVGDPIPWYVQFARSIGKIGLGDAYLIASLRKIQGAATSNPRYVPQLMMP